MEGNLRFLNLIPVFTILKANDVLILWETNHRYFRKLTPPPFVKDQPNRNGDHDQGNDDGDLPSKVVVGKEGLDVFP